MALSEGHKRQQPPGQPEVPPPGPLKAVIEISDAYGKRIPVYEGQGVNRDIVVIGRKPEEISGSHTAGIYVEGGVQILSVSEGRGFHVETADLTAVYLDKKGVEEYSPMGRDRMQRDMVRIQVAYDGPEKRFVIDGKKPDPEELRNMQELKSLGGEMIEMHSDPIRAQEAFRVLAELGVGEGHVVFNRAGFNSKPSYLFD